MGDQEDGHWDSCVFVSNFGSHLQWDAASERSQPKYLWKDNCEVKYKGNFERICGNYREHSA